MSRLSMFGTPAFWQDFPEDPKSQAQLNATWSQRAEGWIQQAILGNPWNQTYSAYQTLFYDPTQTDIPAGTAAAQIAWTAFPGRIDYYLSQGTGTPYSYSAEDLLSLADSGYDSRGNSFPPIPKERCPLPNWKGTLIPFGPYGPRGWLDEYCEWSVARNTDGKILRIDFVCENPEYWYTLWRISPEKVRSLYQDILNYDAPADRQITVTLEELTLKDVTGNQVLDPSTNAPCYNPLSKWNSGPASVRAGIPAHFTGGAIHLTSTPNTLQTELGLGGGSTVPRQSGNSDPQALLCCGQYGQNYRNSDPHIGQSINQLVSSIPARICLADPLGLYLQMPDTSGWTFAPGVNAPPGAVAGDVFQVIRGSATLTDPVTGQAFASIGGGNGGFILHAVCQIPSAWLKYNPNLTLADIWIDANTQSIHWGGNVARQMQVALYGRPLALAAAPPALPCVGSPAISTPQPLQLFTRVVWDAYYATHESTPVSGGPDIPLASNTTIVPTDLAVGACGEFALTYAPTDAPNLPIVQFSTPDGSAVDPSITVIVRESQPAHYAVPGNSYPDDYAVLYMTIIASANTAAGIRGVQMVDSGSQPPANPLFMPSLLLID